MISMFTAMARGLLTTVESIVEPAFPGWEEGEAAHPDSIGPTRREVLLNQVGERKLTLARLGRDAKARRASIWASCRSLSRGGAHRQNLGSAIHAKS